MPGRKLPRELKQDIANPASLAVRTNIEMANEVIPHCHERYRVLIHLSHPNLILLPSKHQQINREAHKAREEFKRVF
jgi:hypothetical protein